MIELRESGGLTEIGGVFVREASGLTEIGEVYLREASGLTLVWSLTSDLAATASPPSVYGAAASPIAVAVTTGSTTASATGGVEPYSYHWTIVDDGIGPPTTWEAVTPNSASTQFRTSPLAAGEDAAGTATCTVTDDRGNTAQAIVNVSAVNYGKL